jgi:hypothetical protein
MKMNQFEEEKGSDTQREKWKKHKTTTEKQTKEQTNK